MLNKLDDKKNYIIHFQQRLTRKLYKIIRNGLLKGFDEAQITCRDFMDNWDLLLKKLQENKINCIIKNAHDIIENELTHKNTLIIPMATKLLKNIAEHTNVELTTHQVHGEIIRNSLGEIATACASLRKVVVIEDGSLEKGSLVIKANKSIIDAHIKTQLDKAKEVLYHQMGISNGTTY